LESKRFPSCRMSVFSKCTVKQSGPWSSQSIWNLQLGVITCINIYTIYIIWIPPQFCGSNCKPGTWPQVFRHSFWMRGFGSRTPKRTTIWSNSSAIRFFTTSKKARRVVDRKLADSYVDGAGRKRFKGNANLRKSQYFGYLYDNFVY
jgi:hypothetical protein